MSSPWVLETSRGTPSRVRRTIKPECRLRTNHPQRMAVWGGRSGIQRRGREPNWRERSSKRKPSERCSVPKPVLHRADADGQGRRQQGPFWAVTPSIAPFERLPGSCCDSPGGLSLEISAAPIVG
jgi:hypothetical protein